MCKVEELVANQFVELTGVHVSENKILGLKVYPQKREPLKQLLRSVLPNLRIRNSNGLVTVADFANYIENAENKKKTFFDKGLRIVRDVTGNQSLSFEDDLYAELRPKTQSGNTYLSEQCRYFLVANKVYSALSAGLKGEGRIYYPPVSGLEGCRQIYAMIDLYYRKGKF